MRVAAVQFKPKLKDPRTNLQRMVELATQAAEKGARLVVFPELAVSGYSFMSKQDAEGFAETLQNPGQGARSPSLVIMRALARKLDIHLIWGVLERSVGTDNLFNSQVLMCPDGEFETYSKINLFANDFLYVTSGKRNPPIRNIVVDGSPYKVGLLICRDIRDRATDNGPSFYEPGDADIVCLSSSWGDGGFPATSWIEFAKTNRTNLLVSNRYGQELNNNFGEGGICLIRPTGAVDCAGLEWSKDCIVFGDV